MSTVVIAFEGAGFSYDIRPHCSILIVSLFEPGVSWQDAETRRDKHVPFITKKLSLHTTTLHRDVHDPMHESEQRTVIIFQLVRAQNEEDQSRGPEMPACQYPPKYMMAN